MESYSIQPVFVRPAGGAEMYSESDGATASDRSSSLVFCRRVCDHWRRAIQRSVSRRLPQQPHRCLPIIHSHISRSVLASRKRQAFSCRLYQLNKKIKTYFSVVEALLFYSSRATFLT